MISRQSRGVHCTIFSWIVGRFNDASLWQRFIANVGHPSCKHREIYEKLDANRSSHDQRF